MDPTQMEWDTHPNFEEALGGLIGATSIMGLNYGTKRPTMARKPFVLMGTIAGVIVGNRIKDWNDKKNLRRDLYLLDYKEKHPELFPEQQRKKYADVFEPWVPHR